MEIGLSIMQWSRNVPPSMRIKLQENIIIGIGKGGRGHTFWNCPPIYLHQEADPEVE